MNRAVVALFNISCGSVSKIFLRLKSEKNVSCRLKSGRPRKSRERTDKARTKSSKKIEIDLCKHANEALGLKISVRTARRIFKRAQLLARSHVKKKSKSPPCFCFSTSTLN